MNVDKPNKEQLNRLNPTDLTRKLPALDGCSSLEFLVSHDLVKELNACQPDKKTLNTFFNPIMSPLHLAANNGFSNMVRFLLDQGADPLLKNSRGEIALHYALSLPFLHSDELILQKLVCFRMLSQEAKDSLLYKKEDGRNVLHEMVLGEFNELLEVTLKSHGELCQHADNVGRLPVHTAVLNGHIKALEVLLQQAPPESMVDFEGKNPLHYAAMGYSPAALEVCIKAFSSLDGQDRQGKTPLMLAASFGLINNLNALISAGANLKRQDETQRTALQLAIFESEAQTAATLAAMPGTTDALNEAEQKQLKMLLKKS
jgi:ankyrin repeat protein